MKITLYGTGYVGLVTGACFAELGHDVLCVDIDQHKIEQLENGVIPIYEPGLEDIVTQNHHSGRLKFTTDTKLGVAHGLVQMITVNTPTSKNGSANTDFIMNCVKTIAMYMDSYRLIVNKSTAPVGTVAQIQKAMYQILQQRYNSNQNDSQSKMNNESLGSLTHTNELARLTEKTCRPSDREHGTPMFHVASNPEFLREGAAVRDFLDPDRIIIGTNSDEAKEILDELYASFNQTVSKVIHMDIESAELTKYAANAMLATKISFINEIANIAEKVGADIQHVRRGLAMDPRIGPHFISPGCGYGGSCFPKDVKALVHIAEQYEIEAHMLKAVELTNTKQKQMLFRKVSDYFNDQLEGKIFAVWGLAFKPNTNDIREASSRVLLEALWQTKAYVQAYDPVAMPEIKKMYLDQEYLNLCVSKEASLKGADALIVCTEWAEFSHVRLEDIRNQLKKAVIFDGRNVFNMEQAKALGFDYFGVGR